MFSFVPGLVEKKITQGLMVLGAVNPSRTLDNQREQFQEDPMNVNLIGSTTHSGLMYVTPEPYEDDVNAFLYYMTMGMLDPTNIADVPFWKAKGWSTPAAFGLMTLRATIIGGLIGWFVDPMNKREGGIAEYEWYKNIKKNVYDEPKEGLSKEWRERDDPDLAS